MSQTSLFCTGEKKSDEQWPVQLIVLQEKQRNLFPVQHILNFMSLCVYLVMFCVLEFYVFSFF